MYAVHATCTGKNIPVQRNHYTTALRQQPQNLLPALLQVVLWLLDSLTLSQSDTTPATAEAQRLIRSFLGSLYNPDMEIPPQVHEMMSMSTLTPHYEVSCVDHAVYY